MVAFRVNSNQVVRYKCTNGACPNYGGEYPFVGIPGTLARQPNALGRDIFICQGCSGVLEEIRLSK